MGFQLLNDTVVDEYEFQCQWNNEWDLVTTLVSSIVVSLLPR